MFAGTNFNRQSPTNALSFDVEEWYHAEFVRGLVKPGTRTSTLPRALSLILDLLDRYRVRATFFIVGEVVLQHPDLAQKLIASGHEIGCHGMTHRPLWELGQDGFRQELREFQATLDSTLRRHYRVQGFRAPTFSLDSRTRWAIRELEDQGYRYDSSVFPCWNGLFGVSGAPLKIYRPCGDDLSREDSNGRMLEFPPAVLNLGFRRIPVGGGAYLRACPDQLLRLALRRINRNRPFLIYVHPWELSLPRVIPVPLKQRAFLRFRVGSTLGKLERLLRSFRFTTAAEVLGITEQSISGVRIGGL